MGKLQPNTLTVDNLTVDWLRSKLADLENSVKECQEKQLKMQMDNGSTTPPIPIINGIGRKENKYVRHLCDSCFNVLLSFTILFFSIRRYSKDFNALRCHEKQMLKLADLIKTALNEVGCEELPSGCDDISVDQSFIENNISNTEQPVCLILFVHYFVIVKNKIA